ncbi:FA5-like protein [Mya arenaria]|uniref:FA5-like protein n=1 Tax=Mya arenaria TaxID=6604 RepID=A0ABY7G3D3_MYAAR|nr:FA5-like protein [Mya arenaria]
MEGKGRPDILLHTKLRMANMADTPPEVDDGFHHVTGNEEYLWEHAGEPDTLEHSLKSLPEADQVTWHKEQKRRKRRTRAFIWITIIIMAALALGTALVIHYFFIPAHEDPKDHLNISISNGSILEGPEDVTQRLTADDNIKLDDVIAVIEQEVDNMREKSHHKDHVLKTNNKILENVLINTTASTTTVTQTKQQAKTETTTFTTEQTTVPRQPETSTEPHTTLADFTTFIPTASINPLYYFGLDLDISTRPVSSSSVTSAAYLDKRKATTQSITQSDKELIDNANVSTHITHEVSSIASTTSMDLITKHSAKQTAKLVKNSTDPAYESTTYITSTESVISKDTNTTLHKYSTALEATVTSALIVTANITAPTTNPFFFDNLTTQEQQQTTGADKIADTELTQPFAPQNSETTTPTLSRATMADHKISKTTTPMPSNKTTSDPLISETTTPMLTNTTTSDPQISETSTPMLTNTTMSDPQTSETTKPMLSNTTMSDPQISETTTSMPSNTTMSDPQISETTTPMLSNTTMSDPQISESTTPMFFNTTMSDPQISETTTSMPSNTTMSDPQISETSTPMPSNTTMSDPQISETTTPMPSNTTMSDPQISETSTSMPSNTSMSDPHISKTTTPMRSMMSGTNASVSSTTTEMASSATEPMSAVTSTVTEPSVTTSQPSVEQTSVHVESTVTEKLIATTAVKTGETRITMSEKVTNATEVSVKETSVASSVAESVGQTNSNTDSTVTELRVTTETSTVDINERHAEISTGRTVTFVEVTSEQSEPSTDITSTEMLQTTTMTLPENYNTANIHDETSYTHETAIITCNVEHAIQWTSLKIEEKDTFRPLTVTLQPSGSITWNGKTSRQDAMYNVTSSEDGLGDNVTLQLVIHDVQCRDGRRFECFPSSNLQNRRDSAMLIVVLRLGPSVVENRALRVTASWQAGYPVPWANISWTATDAKNNTYNLEKYGKFRDYNLDVDDRRCQTTLTTSIVIFPKVHLNATVVSVSPDMHRKRAFLEADMTRYLETVRPGVDTILVIPPLSHWHVL